MSTIFNSPGRCGTIHTFAACGLLGMLMLSSVPSATAMEACSCTLALAGGEMEDLKGEEMANIKCAMCGALLVGTLLGLLTSAARGVRFAAPGEPDSEEEPEPTAEPSAPPGPINIEVPNLQSRDAGAQERRAAGAAGQLAVPPPKVQTGDREHERRSRGSRGFRQFDGCDLHCQGRRREMPYGGVVVGVAVSTPSRCFDAMHDGVVTVAIDILRAISKTQEEHK